jgi:hypothetical protein
MQRLRVCATFVAGPERIFRETPIGMSVPPDSLQWSRPRKSCAPRHGLLMRS